MIQRQNIIEEKYADNQKILVLSSTREQTKQINEELKRLNNGINFVIGTPDKVLDLIQKGQLKTYHLQYLLIDDVDQILNAGLKKELKSILEAIPKEKRQTILFTDTFPDCLHEICQNHLKESHTFDLSVSENVEFYALMENENDQLNGIAGFLRRKHTLSILKQKMKRFIPLEFNMQQSLIITTSKHDIQDFTSTLKTKLPLLKISALFSELSLQTREDILKEFKQKEIQVLCCTKEVANDLDLKNINSVIQMNLFEELKEATDHIPYSEMKPFYKQLERVNQNGKVLIVLPPEKSFILPLLNKHLVQTVEIFDYKANMKNTVVKSILLGVLLISMLDYSFDYIRSPTSEHITNERQ